MRTFSQNFLIAVLAALVLAGCGPSEDPQYDLVIRGGTVFDGTGAPGRIADVAIVADRIVAVGTIDGDGERNIDAAGLYVAPGFVDMHSHSEVFRLLNGGHGPSFAYQGLTTEIYGETSSMGPLGGLRENDLPDELLGKWETLGDYLDYQESAGSAINFGSYVGSGG
ncbi:MAG: amidohydrolase family protein, partial [Woeseiaceae bacterium]|nr:amidohydrolase family protein [Woeseiaceae bacterium]